jgi:hypothetical protein
MKLKFNKQEYLNCCSRKERAGIAWWRAGIWKLRAIRRGFEKERCPYCYELEDAQHKLLICTERRKCREEFLFKRWMGLDQDLTCKKIVGCKML